MSSSRSIPAIPRTVWLLGLISLFMDMSSEIVHSLLPVLLVTTLGTSVLTVGIIEGIAEAMALIVKVFSGTISDYIGRRKGLLIVGYGLAALSKPLFPLAGSATTVFTARVLDRIGKGIRGAPRDALIADVAPPDIRGACFGLRQSLDTVGAVLGPLLAILLLYWFHNDITPVLWFAVIPAGLSVLLILGVIQESRQPTGEHHFRSPIQLTVWTGFSRSYWQVIIIGILFTLARFSEAFLLLRAQQVGLPLLWLPLVMVIMSATYSLSAYPAGVLSDKMERQSLLGIGLVLLILADLVLARSASGSIVLIGVALWGLHLGFTQGILAAMIADHTPADLKGTAFGLFNFAGGLSLLLASVIAGFLWDLYGADVTFYAGAGFSVLALLTLLLRYHE